MFLNLVHFIIAELRKKMNSRKMIIWNTEFQIFGCSLNYDAFVHQIYRAEDDIPGHHCL